MIEQTFYGSTSFTCIFLCMFCILNEKFENTLQKQNKNRKTPEKQTEKCKIERETQKQYSKNPIKKRKVTSNQKDNFVFKERNILFTKLVYDHRIIYFFIIIATRYFLVTSLWFFGFSVYIGKAWYGIKTIPSNQPPKIHRKPNETTTFPLTVNFPHRPPLPSL